MGGASPAGEQVAATSTIQMASKELALDVAVRAYCREPKSRKSDHGGPSENHLMRIEPTPKRWLILILFALTSCNKAIQFIQVSAATTQATVYYNVDNWVINMSSIVFMLTFLFMSWPACLIIDKLGIRRVVVYASVGATLGSIVKYCSCFCAQPNIHLLLLGCVLVSLSEQLVFSVPSRLVSVWFPDHQVSLAMSFCVQGCISGVAIGFVVPEFFLAGAESLADIEAGFKLIFFWTIVVSATLLTLNYFLFDEAPLNPPGEARMNQILLELEIRAQQREEPSVVEKMRVLVGQVLQLFRNKDLVLVALIYGISFGRGDTVSTLLDQSLRPLYPANGSIVATTGCLYILSGALSLPIWGRILDACRAYKVVGLSMTLLNGLTLVIFYYAIAHFKWIPGVYIAAFLFGFFQSGFMVVGLDFAVELTYPAPELVTASLLNVMPAIAGSIFILIGSPIVDNFSLLALFGLYSLTVVVQFVGLLCVNEQLKRQAAINLRLAGEGAEKSDFPTSPMG